MNNTVASLLNKSRVLVGLKSENEKKLKRTRTAVKRIKRDLDNHERAQQILQLVAKRTQDAFALRLSSIVTECLRSIFEEPYDFEVRYDTARGKTQVDFVFIRDGIPLNSPLDSVGGGVVDIASFALRIAAFLLATPQPLDTVIMDEPFRFLSKNLHDKAGLLLDTLSSELNLQFIIISHEPNLISSLEEKASVITISKGTVQKDR